MKKFTKLGISCLVGILLLSLISPIVFAETLREKDEAARVRYRAAKEQYLKEVNSYRTTREQLQAARERYREFRTAENKAEFEEQARAFLEQTVEVLIKKLEALKNWVSNRRGLSEEEKQRIIAEIEKDITWLQNQKAGIETASPEQIKEKAKELRQYWKEHRVHLKRIIAQIFAARLRFVIEKLEDISEKIADKIEDLKAAGKDTVQLEAWLAEFNQKIAAAKAKQEVVKTKWQAISSPAEANQLFREAHQAFKEANSYLREAQQTLIDIVKELKE